MFDIAPFLKRMISLSGLSGQEGPIREVIADAWRPLVDELDVSRLGSLHGLRRGQGDSAARRLSIMIATHMDGIGLMVTDIHQGLLHITGVGGVDPRILPGQLVTVHARRDLPAVVVQPPDRLLPAEARGKPVEIKYLLVDTGLLPEEVASLVRPGDLVSFAQPPLELAGESIAGHTLDNRASVAALTYALHELQHVRHTWDVWAVATVQEEVVLGGGYTSTFALRPDIAVAVDVTFARGPGASDYRTHPFGKGVPLGWGANIHPALYRSFKELAESLDIPSRMDVMPGNSGTDAVATQVTAEGIPSMVISIPLRYMHTPVEIVQIKDIRRVGQLLAAFIARLEPDYLDTIRWE
jgi:endoglucanase